MYSESPVLDDWEQKLLGKKSVVPYSGKFWYDCRVIFWENSHEKNSSRKLMCVNGILVSTVKKTHYQDVKIFHLAAK